MANQYGIDYGNVLARASDLKTAKLNQEAKTEEMKAAKEQRQTKLEQMSRQKSNVSKMASADPRMAGYEVETAGEFNQIQTFLNNADNKTKAEALQKVETIAKYSMAILNSEDPNQKKQMWEDLKARIPASSKGDMPDEYNERWLIMKTTEAKSIKDMIEQDVAKVKTKAAQDKVQQEYLNSAKLESQKQANKKALEDYRAKNVTTTTKADTKLEKLFNLRDKIEKENPNDPRLKLIDNSINKESKGKSSYMGTIPAGYQVVEEGGITKMTPIPGSEAEKKLKSQEEKIKKSATLESRAAKTVQGKIQKLKDKIESQGTFSPVTGALSQIIPDIAAQKRVDAEKLKETIVANIGFDRLQQMREASPTGGALGAVSERELSNLQSVMGNLDFAQSEEQILDTLDEINTTYSEIMKKFEVYPTENKTDTTTDEVDIDALVNKYTTGN